jgi:hypothetical protein
MLSTDLRLGRPRGERNARLAERICFAILAAKDADGLSDRDVFATVPWAIARYIAITFQAVDRELQFAAVESIFRHLGRSLLSAGYDPATIESMLCLSDTAVPIPKGTVRQDVFR